MRFAMASDCWPSVTMVVDSLPTTARSHVPSISSVTDSSVTPTLARGGTHAPPTPKRPKVRQFGYVGFTQTCTCTRRRGNASTQECGAHLFGDVGGARGDGDVLEHVLAAGPEPGRLDGHHVQHAAHLMAKEKDTGLVTGLEILEH